MAHPQKGNGSLKNAMNGGNSADIVSNTSNSGMFPDDPRYTLENFFLVMIHYGDANGLKIQPGKKYYKGYSVFGNRKDCEFVVWPPNPEKNKKYIFWSWFDNGTGLRGTAPEFIIRKEGYTGYAKYARAFNKLDEILDAATRKQIKEAKELASLHVDKNAANTDRWEQEKRKKSTGKTGATKKTAAKPQSLPLPPIPEPLQTKQQTLPPVEVKEQILPPVVVAEERPLPPVIANTPPTAASKRNLLLAGKATTHYSSKFLSEWSKELACSEEEMDSKLQSTNGAVRETKDRRTLFVTGKNSDGTVMAGKIYDHTGRIVQKQYKHIMLPGGGEHLFGEELMKKRLSERAEQTKAKNLIITKSPKDALVLLLRYDWPYVLGVLSESWPYPPHLMEYCVKHFRRIHILYDSDETGRREAAKRADELNALYARLETEGQARVLFFPDDGKGKDATDRLHSLGAFTAGRDIEALIAGKD